MLVRRTLVCFAALWLGLGTVGAASGGPGLVRAQDLRLVPFPKRVRVLRETFTVRSVMRIIVTETAAAVQAARDLKEELQRVTRSDCDIETIPARAGQGGWLSLSEGPMTAGRMKAIVGKLPSQDESYKLVVSPDAALVGSRSERGLLWGVQILRQLVRASMVGDALPCVQVTDWPSLRYRGFSHDITRGPSPLFETLARDVRLSAFLGMNFFTYYMEGQFEFRKHPVIYPEGGCLTQRELRSLVKYARDYSVEIIGNQQSLAHFGFAVSRYPHLAEMSIRGNILDPTNEESYRLLDDFYSEQAPLLDSQFFNVDCDEADALGTGRAKPVADKIGQGGLYARHMTRIHDILRDKYGKRMMMWGDIIINHPDIIKDIPRDTIMLSWCYMPWDSFDSRIVPIADAGFDFFVCPGVACWGRMLPDFAEAVLVIRNYVRDGAKHGAMGMMNTAWMDDGENFQACNWHGIAWGAECAWNASATPFEDFNRRVGAVLFGEDGDHFGRAIALLGKLHRPDAPMQNARFWELPDFGQSPADREASRGRAQAMIHAVGPALKHLRAAKNDAKVNADLLDYHIFGAERVRLLATRTLGFFAAAEAYQRAAGANSEQELRTVIVTVSRIRDEHVRLKEQYCRLWLLENKPYALDRVTKKFDDYIAGCDSMVARVTEALATVREGGSLPPAAEVGLGSAESKSRN